MYNFISQSSAVRPVLTPRLIFEFGTERWQKSASYFRCIMSYAGHYSVLLLYSPIAYPFPGRRHYISWIHRKNTLSPSPMLGKYIDSELFVNQNWKNFLLASLAGVLYPPLFTLLAIEKICRECFFEVWCRPKAYTPKYVCMYRQAYTVYT